MSCAHQHPANLSKYFQDLQNRDLLSFEHQDDPENTISLCPECHDSFERGSNPSFIFFPKDISFFIDYEMSDYEYRKAILDKSDSFPRRRVPTVREYRSYQEREGVKFSTSDSARAGLYQHCIRTVDKRGSRVAQLNANTYPTKTWAGCPMAAFAKTFSALGSWGHKFPKDMKEELRELQDLYTDNDDALQRMYEAAPVYTRDSESYDDVEVTNSEASCSPEIGEDMYAEGPLRNHDRPIKDDSEAEELTPKRKRAKYEANPELNEYPESYNAEELAISESSYSPDIGEDRVVAFQIRNDEQQMKDDPEAKQRTIKRKRSISTDSSTIGKSQATTEDGDNSGSRYAPQTKSFVWGPEGTSQGAIKYYEVQGRLARKGRAAWRVYKPL